MESAQTDGMKLYGCFVSATLDNDLADLLKIAESLLKGSGRQDQGSLLD